MKRLQALVLIFAILSSYACEKATKKEEPQSAPTSNPASKAPKAPKEKRKSYPVQDLELHNENNLLATVAKQDYDSLPATKLKVRRRDREREMSAVLVSDVLKKYNVPAGKTVVFSGPAQSISLAWDKATNDQIYVVKGLQNRYHIYDKEQKLKMSGPLTKIQVTQQVEETAKTEPVAQ